MGGVRTTPRGEAVARMIGGVAPSIIEALAVTAPTRAGGGADLLP